MTKFNLWLDSGKKFWNYHVLL